jgi:glycerol uptake facilitator-like aquaporin
MPVIIKKFIAEIIGTFIFLFIALAIGIITGGNLLITAIGFGVGITTAILIVGHVSGAHLNPAVSLACVLNKKMT